MDDTVRVRVFTELKKEVINIVPQRIKIYFLIWG